jgi:hypothetical protein
VRYIRTTLVPGDEQVLHLFKAPSNDTVRRVMRNAALSFERIVESVGHSAQPQQENQ